MQSQPPKIRKQVVITHVPDPSPSSTHITSSASTRASPSLQVAKQNETPRSQSAQPRSQKSRKRPSPIQARLESDSDDEISEKDHPGTRRKRARLSTEPPVDKERQIRSREAFSKEQSGRFTMVHAAHIACLSKHTQYKVAFQQPQPVTVSLQYPSAVEPEM